MTRLPPVCVLALVLGLAAAPLPAQSSLRSDVRAGLMDAVSAALADSSATVNIRSWRPQRPELLGRAKGLDRVELLSGERPYGNVTARVWLRMPGGKSEAMYATAQVDALVRVYVTRRRLGRDEALGQDVVTSRSMSLGSLPVGAIRSGEPLQGLRTARPLGNGVVLTRRAATTPLLVRRGEQVGVHVRVGGVSVRGSGKALKSGHRGERITVRLAPSGQVLMVTVTGPGEVGAVR